MQVQVQTDNHIDNREELARFVESAVMDKVSRFQDQLTSVQVHLHDDNGPDKKGDNDFRCMLEARLTGLKPVAVNQHAASLHQAIAGGCDKLERALESHIGKLETRKKHAPPLGEVAPNPGVPPAE